MLFSSLRAGTTIRTDLGSPCANLAAASLGQVHAATTLAGEAVAVKVQYLDIAKALAADVENLGAMVAVMATTTRLTHGKAYYAELREALLDELDYRAEAERARTFARAAAPVRSLVVPRVYDELSSGRVLTMERLFGRTLKELLHDVAAAPMAERFAASRLVMHAVWGPFLVSGVIHADPHPGNFMLLPDGRMGVLDFGAIKALSPPWLTANRRLFRSACDGSRYDAWGESVACGFTFGDEQVARRFVDEVIAIATRPARATPFDYGRSATWDPPVAFASPGADGVPLRVGVQRGCGATRTCAPRWRCPRVSPTTPPP